MVQGLVHSHGASSAPLPDTLIKTGELKPLPCRIFYSPQGESHITHLNDPQASSEPTSTLHLNKASFYFIPLIFFVQKIQESTKASKVYRVYNTADGQQPSHGSEI